MTPDKEKIGLELIHRFRNGVKVVGMTEWRGRLYIATEKGIYVKDNPDSRLRKIEPKGK